MVLYASPEYRMMGDRSFLVELGNHIGMGLHTKVRALFMALGNAPPRGVVEIVPAYGSVLIVFDPLTTRFSHLREQVQTILKTLDPSQITETRTLEVPVAYGGEHGPDLGWVAAYHGITPEEVIRLHTSVVYHVYMIGFMPGFPYMGELPEALVTPRKETPRTEVPIGSVAIAQAQTGIYPSRSPGGWQLIGRTPLRLFDASRWPPALLQTGDQVRFIAVTEEAIEGWKP